MFSEWGLPSLSSCEICPTNGCWKANKTSVEVKEGIDNYMRRVDKEKQNHQTGERCNLLGNEQCILRCNRPYI